MNDSKNAHRSIDGIFTLAMIVLGCTVLGFEDTGATDAENGGHFPIDLDEDGTTDFALKRSRPMGHETAGGQTVRIVPKENSEIIRRRREDGYVAALHEGDLIGQMLPDTLEWASQTTTLYRASYHTSQNSTSVRWRWQGPWPVKQDQYLGLKLNREGKIYFGWAHVRVDTSKAYGAVHVRASGYNSSPGQAIRTGLDQ